MCILPPKKDKCYKKTNNRLQFNRKIHRTTLKPEHKALLDLEVSKSLILCIQGMKRRPYPQIKRAPCNLQFKKCATLRRLSGPAQMTEKSEKIQNLKGTTF